MSPAIPENGSRCRSRAFAAGAFLEAPFLEGAGLGLRFEGIRAG
jgi:hypothetical protein